MCVFIYVCVCMCLCMSICMCVRVCVLNGYSYSVYTMLIVHFHVNRQVLKVGRCLKRIQVDRACDRHVNKFMDEKFRMVLNMCRRIGV